MERTIDKTPSAEIRPILPVTASTTFSALSQVATTSNLAFSAPVARMPALPQTALHQPFSSSPFSSATQFLQRPEASFARPVIAVTAQPNIISNITTPDVGPLDLSKASTEGQRYKKWNLFGKNKRPAISPPDTSATAGSATVTKADDPYLNPVASTSGYRPETPITVLYEKTSHSPDRKRQATSSAEVFTRLVSANVTAAIAEAAVKDPEDPVRYILKSLKEKPEVAKPIVLPRPFLKFEPTERGDLLPGTLQTAKITHLEIGSDKNILSIYKKLGIADKELIKYHRFSELARIMFRTDMIGYPIDDLEKKINNQNKILKIPSTPGMDSRLRINHEFRDYINMIAEFIDPSVISALNDPENSVFNIAGVTPEAINITKIIEPELPLSKKIKENRKKILANRTIRQLGHLFVSGASIYTLLQNYVDNAQKDSSEMIKDAATYQTKEYINRLGIILDTLKIGPLAISGVQQSSYINISDILYQDKGLGFRSLHGWAISKNSDQWLEMMAYYCNYRLEEITQTGDVNLRSFEGLSDETLAMIFNRSFNQDSTTAKYNMGNFDDIKTIMNSIYTTEFDYMNLDHFLNWIRNTALISGDNNDIARMLFDKKPVTIPTLSTIASCITSTMGNMLDDKYKTEAIESHIKSLCEKILPEGHNYPGILTKKEVEEKVNKIDREDILKFSAKELDVNIAMYDAQGDYQGYYDTEEQFIINQLPPRENDIMVLTPHYLLPDRGNFKGRFKDPQSYSTNHDLLLMLRTNSAQAIKTKITHKNIALENFNFEKELTETAAQPTGAAGSSQQQ